VRECVLDSCRTAVTAPVESRNHGKKSIFSKKRSDKFIVPLFYPCDNKSVKTNVGFTRFEIRKIFVKNSVFSFLSLPLEYSRRHQKNASKSSPYLFREVCL
jgi:hypothetical protein